MVSKGFLRTEERSGEDAGDRFGDPCMNDDGGVTNGVEEDDDGEVGLGGGDGGDGDRSGEGGGDLWRGTLAPLHLVLAMICLKKKKI